MKKILALLICITLAIGLSACGSTKKTVDTSETFSDVITIGDGVADINIKGACFGTYKIIDLDHDYLENGKKAVTYYDENSDTPYIEVFSIAKNGMSLEEYTKTIAEKYGNGYYQMGENFGYYTGPWEDETGFYYCSSLIYEGDEQFHDVCFSAKTEEINIADNVYIWVPTGYTEKNFNDVDPVFSCSYEESYALPNIDITVDPGTYESGKDYYSYNGEMNCTKEEHEEWTKNGNAEAVFEAVGYKLTKTFFVDSDAGTLVGFILDNQRKTEPFCGNAYVTVNGTEYRMQMWCEEGTPAYPYLYTLMKSVHTKGESTVNTSKIDLGGGLGTITPEGDAFGTYKIIETPADLVFEDAETTVYEDLNSDTPYIAVFRFAKNGYTLETIAQEESGLYCNGYYQMFDDGDKGFSGAYFCHPYVINGNYYYTDTRIVEDGDDFVEVSFFGKTEELQIGDTNVYAYVPVGYTSYMDDDYKAHGAIFAAAYREDYCFPAMFVGKWGYTYEYMKWFFEEDYPDGLPISEEEHAQLVERFANGEADMYEYFELFGDTVVYNSLQDEKQSFDYNARYYVIEGGKSEGTEIWFEIADDWYVTWFESDLDPKPAYAIAFLSSLHTK